MGRFHTGLTANVRQGNGGAAMVSARPVWQQVAARFAEPRECLASYLALEAAEVLAGAKPANLISIANHPRSCGRNPYELWKQWGITVLAGSGLTAFELMDRGEAVLLLIYSKQAIDRLLQKANVAAVLKKAGYDDLSCRDLVLNELATRVASGSFPHEIGVFLGYPLKDVAAFMGLVNIPFSCQGPWRIFGNPSESLRLAETFRCCRLRMAERLSGCDSPLSCLRDETRSTTFLGKAVERAIHT